VSNTAYQIRYHDVRIPRQHVTFPPRPKPSAHAAGPSPADSDDKVLIARFSLRAALVLCGAEVSLPRPGVSCLSSSLSC
jgi:hypothetical protein